MQYFLPLICVSVPPLLATILFKHWCAPDLDIPSAFVAYSILLGFVNLAPMTMVTFVTKHPNYVMMPSLFTIGFSTKYLFSAFIAAVVIPKVCQMAIYFKNNKGLPAHISDVSEGTFFEDENWLDDKRENVSEEGNHAE